MLDGLCLFDTRSTYLFHHFLTPEFNDKHISQRLASIRLKINKQQLLKKKIEKDSILLYPTFPFLNSKLKD